jgi:chromosome partitioning protein
MAERGITGAVQDQIVQSITSFALYGFPESHAASFALIAYASAYLKAHHPTAFTIALLNAWPMGFYHPATLIKDAQRHGVALVMPEHRRIAAAEAEIRDRETADDGARFIKALSELSRQQVIVIDTPGSESHLTRLAHNEADTLITPLNDSFVDIDVLAKVDRERRAVQAPSVYTQMVWEQNNRRVVEGRAPIDWVVMRNRMTHIDARNKRDIVSLLDKLAARVGFRLAPGFGERMVYRELFLKGLTLFDLAPGEEGYMESASHAAARQEVTDLLATIGVPIRT